MSNETENTTVETTEVAPLESWDDADSGFQADASLMDQAIEVAMDESKAEIVADGKEEVETNSTESENTVQEVKEEETTVKTDEKEEETKPETIKVKVAGKEEEVTLDDLKTNYSGKVAYDKKFTELDKERKAFVAEKNEIETYVNEFREIATSQNMVEATKYLGSITGKAPHDVVNELIDALAPEIERRYSLTDDELSLEQKSAEIKYTQEKLEAETAKLQSQQSTSALNAKIEAEMSTHKISSDEWEKAVHDLDAKLPKDEVITPEIVGQYVQFGRANTTVTDVLTTYEDGKFSSNVEVVNGLRDIIIENPDFSNEDLVDVLNDALNTTQKQQVEEKLSKKVSSETITTKQDAPKISSPASWDDIL